MNMPDGKPVYGVVLFHTNSAALKAEKILLKDGLKIKLIPTPREFSSDCGVALRFDWSDETRTRALLDFAHVETASIQAMK
jgi:hypothetical protein